MFSLKILKSCGNINRFSLVFPKFNFARKTGVNNTKANKNIKAENFDNREEEDNSKTINVVRQEVPIRITPYFSQAVSEREKSASSINISQLVVTGKKESDLSIRQREEVIKTKQKLVAAKRQKASRTIGIVVENIKRELPKEFFRMGLTDQDMMQHHPLVQRALSLDNSSIGEFKKARMLEIRKMFSSHERDTATPPVTACALCEQVLALLSHIKKNKNDMTAFLKLQKYLTKRRRYLLYLKRTDFNSYSYIIKYYGIKDFDDHQHKTFKRMLTYGKMPAVEHAKRMPLRMND